MATVLILGVTTALTAQSSWLEHTVSVQFTDLPLEQALYRLLDEHRLPLSFRNDQLPAQRVSVTARDRSVRWLLDHLLQHTGLTYRFVAGQIIISPRSLPTSVTVSGYIEDAYSGERLISATVVVDGGQYYTLSNEYGFFSLTLPPGTHRFEFSYLGHTPLVETWLVDRHRSMRVQLLSQLTLQEVVVTPHDSIHPVSLGAGPQHLSLLDQAEMPTLAGEPDPVRALAMLPGITSGADGLEGIHIRGSEAGHNLVLLDGVPVYNLNHAGGLFSIFNPQVIRSVDLYRSGIPAQYGGRLGGVLDVRTKEGNLFHWQAQAATGLLTGKATVEGPLLPGRSSVLLAGRWSFIHPLLRSYSRQQKRRNGVEGQLDYRFDDLNLKVNHSFSSRDRLYLSWYQGDDYYDNESDRTNQVSLRQGDGTNSLWSIYQRYHEGLTWGNRVGALRWNHLVNERLFTNLSLIYSRLNVNGETFRLDSLKERNYGQVLRAFQLTQFNTGIEDRGGRFDAQFLPRPGTDWRFGGAFLHHSFNPSILIVDENSNSTANPPGEQDAPTYSNELNLYAQLHRTHPNWWWQAGLHLAHWSVRQANHWQLQPRLQLGGQLGRRAQWSASYDRTVQPIHLLSSSAINLPTDLWVPATDQVAPAVADQINVHVSHRWGPHWSLRSDLFMRRLDQLVTLSEGATTVRDWENNVTTGSGRVAGLELMLQREHPRLSGWLAYTLSRSDRQFERVNLGRSYPFKYDRRHDLKLVVFYRPRPGWSISGNWMIASGAAYSLYLEKFRVATMDTQIDLNGLDVLVFGSKNQFRLPLYHRLDLSINRSWQSGSHWKHNLRLGLYNAYNRRNPILYDLRTNYINRDDEIVANRFFVQLWLVSALPNLSYNLTFGK